MNSKKILATVVAALMATSSVAFGQGRGDRRDDNRNDNRRGDQRDNRNDNNRNDNNRYHEWRNGDRGGGPNHSFHRGDRLPPQYRNRTYVVDDWRGHGLRQPPRGYHWVQTGADYVLVALATGIIASILLDNY